MTPQEPDETWADQAREFSDHTNELANELFGTKEIYDKAEAVLDDVGLDIQGPRDDILENLDAFEQAETAGDYGEAAGELLEDLGQYSGSVVPGMGLMEGLATNAVEQWTGEEYHNLAEVGYDLAEPVIDSVGETISEAYDTATEAVSDAWDSLDLNPFDDE